MKLLTHHNNRCLLWSAAMILDADPLELVKEIGYTGLEVVSDEPEPYCYRGHHIQEILDVAWDRGVYLTLIQPMPVFPGNAYVYSTADAMIRFDNYIRDNRAILIGQNHAVAWNGQHIYDPNGRIYKISQFGIREAWVNLE